MESTEADPGGEREELELLLKFLRNKIKSMDSVHQTKSVFLRAPKRGSSTVSVKRGTIEELPPAATLLRVDMKQVGCMFCGENYLENRDCPIAGDMSLEGRKKIVTKRKACHRCL